jgi:hypothetical protein
MAFSLKLRGAAKFAKALFAGAGTAVRKDGLAAYVDLDYSLLNAAPNYDPTAQRLAIQSVVDGSFQSVTLAQVIASSQTEQDITAGAVVTVTAGDGLIKINKTTGSATTVNLPPANTKVGAVTISDFKMDSDTNPITVNATGTDTFPGGRTQWVIQDPGQSMTFRPLKDGTGYAI